MLLRANRWSMMSRRKASGVVQILIPGTCAYVTLHGKRDLADEIKYLVTE